MSTLPGPERLAAVMRFYGLLDALDRRLGGRRQLGECDGRTGWPTRGVYFFFEPGEAREGHGGAPRVVRIGTHALTSGSRSTLWGRLATHRGQASGGGNHRGSIFRLLVGTALKARADTAEPASWGIAADPGAAARRLGADRRALLDAEAALEQAVSRHIGAMSVLWLPVDDAPGPESARGLIERNAIALLSHASGPAPDAPSAGWLGHHCDRERVRRSGLWNQNHVDEAFDPAFLDTFEALIAAT